MKQNKGVTLITLMMYIILTLVVLGILGMLSRNFRSNLNNVNVKTAQDVEHDKLNVQLLKETKTTDNLIESGNSNNNNIKFKNGNTYTYNIEDNAVYLNNNIKIAENITELYFEVIDTPTKQTLTMKTTINNKTVVSEYVMSKTALPPGQRVTETTEYIDTNGDRAWIPAGFVVSGIPEEEVIDDGLVIYDIPEGTTVDWTNPDSVKTQYNQFVWIPVEVTASDTETSIEAFKRSEWTANAETGGERTTGLSTDYTEPDSTNDTADKTGIAGQITELTKSIYKYGGFYIGRYEAGRETAGIDGSSETAAFVVQQDKCPYNWVKWGKGMGDISEGAVYLSNSLYTGKTGYGVKSMLCTGAAWDSMLDFIKDRSHNVTSSTSWGNYSDSDTYKVYRGSLSSDRGSTWSAVDTTNGSDVTKDTSILLTTGATERNKRNSSKNIYDVAGNCYEWTTEAFGTSIRVLRGGSCSDSGSGDPASNRANGSPTLSYNGIISFRPLLYVAL